MVRPCTVIWYRGSLTATPLCQQVVAFRSAGKMYLESSDKSSKSCSVGLYCLYIYDYWNCSYCRCTEKTIFPFPFALNGIWSWWQFFFRFSESNRIPFGSKSKRKLSPRSYPIQCDRKCKYSFLSAISVHHSRYLLI